MAETILQSIQWAEAMTGERLGIETDTVEQMAEDYSGIARTLGFDAAELAEAIVKFARENYIPILGLNAGYAAAGLDTGFWAGVRWEQQRGATEHG